jgi:uncharacterized protein YvpB
MNRTGLRRRRSAPVFIWFFLGFVLATAIGLIAMVWTTWQRTQQVQALQTSVAASLAERQTMEVQLVALQRTASAAERRLATLEANTSTQQSGIESQELETLQASLLELQAAVHSLKATVDYLAAGMTALEQTGGEEAQEPLPPQVRLTVARQRQSHSLSCESSAASMAAQYHGVPLSEADVLDALPRNDNPRLGFRGNVDGPTGSVEDYGVYAGPVMSILNSRGLRVWPVKGGLEGIKTVIAQGNPVLVWVTYDCLPSTPTEVMIDGETVTLVPYQHVVVAIGYTPEGVWANDPWDGQEDFYPNADLVRAMAYFGDMAIEVAAP